MKHTILIVDDDKLIRDSMALFLEGEGFSTKTASSGEEAVAILKQTSPAISLAFVDYNMPGIQGPEVISMLRNLDEKLAIVGFSGDDSQGTQNESIDSGATLFASKAIDNLELLTMVHHLCRKSEQPDQNIETHN